MPLLLTSAVPFLAHDHASSAAFFTCRYHNFHGSMIPEFLSDEERVRKFCGARQRNKLEPDEEDTQYKNLYNLFVQTPHMQFSPSLLLHYTISHESIFNPLLATKYFSRTLQRCVVEGDRFVSYRKGVLTSLLQSLSKVQSLTKLDLGSCNVENSHLEIIVNSFPSLEILSIDNAGFLKTIIHSKQPITFTSPPPPAMKTLRALTLRNIDASETLSTTQFICNFSNLRTLEISAVFTSNPLDLQPVCSGLPLLKHISLRSFLLENAESIKNLANLSSLEFHTCTMPDGLSFLCAAEEEKNSLPQLEKLCVHSCTNLSTSSLASALANAPELRVLEVSYDGHFDSDCLQHIEKMVHLRKFLLRYCDIPGDFRFSKNLMYKIEELSFIFCRIGDPNAMARALFNISSHHQLRVLNLRRCALVDENLEGIGALKSTLEVLDLGRNWELTTEALTHCQELVKLKVLDLKGCKGVTDLSPLKHCLNLEELNVARCDGLTDDSFKVFSAQDPDSSFPKLRILDLFGCRRLTENAFEHLSKSNHLVRRLEELNVMRLSGGLLPSPVARNNIYKLKRLRRLIGSFVGHLSESDLSEMFDHLKNLEDLRDCE